MIISTKQEIILRYLTNLIFKSRKNSMRKHDESPQERLPVIDDATDNEVLEVAQRLSNCQHRDFVIELGRFNLDVSPFITFLNRTPISTLYDLIRELNDLSRLGDPEQVDAEELEHRTVLVEQIINLHTVCSDVFTSDTAASDQADAKKQTQLEILDEELLSPLEKDALLAVLEARSPDVEGLDTTNLEDIARFRKTLGTPEPADVVVSIRKARGFKKPI